MSEFEQRVRERAYWLWEAAGRPHGRGDEFWHAARQELEAAHGAATGQPGERVAEQGVLDGRREALVQPPPKRGKGRGRRS